LLNIGDIEWVTCWFIYYGSASYR